MAETLRLFGSLDPDRLRELPTIGDGPAGQGVRSAGLVATPAPEALADADLLELVLARVVPAPEARFLARRLLDFFGDFASVLSASQSRLAEVSGVDTSVFAELKIVEASAHRFARAKVIDRHIISGWGAVVDYCRTTMAHRETEQFRVLFLDRRNYLIADEAQGKGTVDHVPVYPREVVKRALELNACALILVHNHPSGDPTPSDEDIAMTAAIERAAEALSITVHDHIIVGRQGELSFRAAGLL